MRFYFILLCVLCFLIPLDSHGDEPTPLKPGVLVMPLQRGEGISDSQKYSGLTIERLIENMLTLNNKIEECWGLWHYDDIFKTETEFRDWVEGKNHTVPETIREEGIQYLLKGVFHHRKHAYLVDLELQDLKSGSKRTSEIELDFPDFIQFRKDVLHLLNKGGVPRADKNQIPKMLWKENLTPESMALIGNGFYSYSYAMLYNEDWGYTTTPFEEAVRISPQSYLAVKYLAWLNHRKQNFTEACNLFEKALDLNPSGAEAATGMMHCKEASGKESEAEKWAVRWATIQGKDPNHGLMDLWARRGARYYNEKNCAKSVDAYEKVRKIDPDDLDYVVSLSLSYACADRFDDGLKLLVSSTETYSDPADKQRIQESIARIWNMRGNVSYDRKEYELAAKFYEKAAELNPSRTVFWSNAADCYARMNRLEDGNRLLEEALQKASKPSDRQELDFALAEVIRVSADQAVKEKRYSDALIQFGKALESYQTLLKRYPDPASQKELQMLISTIHRYWAGALEQNLNYEEAIRHYESAFDLDLQYNPRDLVQVDLVYLVIIYKSVNQHSRAIDMVHQALEMTKENKNRKDEGVALLCLVTIYKDLGQNDLAIETAKKAREILHEAGDARNEINALGYLAALHSRLQLYDEAAGYMKESLDLAPLVNDPKYTMGALLGLGIAYSRSAYDQKGTIGSYSKALEYFQQCLDLSRKHKNREYESDILAQMADTYFCMKDYKKASSMAREALLISKETKDRESQGFLLDTLMDCSNALGHRELAVFFGKQSVNVYQELRREMKEVNKELNAELQKRFLKSKEDTYRKLANLLISDGRLSEAETVMNMLKQEEFIEFVRGSDPASKELDASILNSKEQEWEKSYEEILNRSVEIGRERSELLSKESRTEEEDAHLAKLEEELSIAGNAFQNFLDSIAENPNSGVAASDSEKLFQLKESQGLMEDLRELGPGVVALYTLVTPEKLWTILITPDVQKAYDFTISSDDLSKLVFKFRFTLQNRDRDPRPLAAEMYRIILGNLKSDLEATKAHTLMWSLDGVLRYLPVSALYDGKQYLVEDFRSVIFTPASLSRLKDVPRHTWKILGLGVTRPLSGFSALPAVKDELNDIVRQGASQKGVLPGVVRLDEAFTKETMTEELRQRYPVVHIASHFQFQPGNELDSYLLLGDGGHLNLGQLKTFSNFFNGVDLLTLSACDTAVGNLKSEDGKEVECFGVLAQRQGAKAVIATLWPVADRSTSSLMQSFYSIRESGPGVQKAEALQKAQLKLLYGEKGHSSGALPAEQLENLDEPVAFEKDLKAPFAHPFFWAPFVLIGNWK